MHRRLTPAHRPQAHSAGRRPNPGLFPAQEPACPEAELACATRHFGAQLQRLYASRPARQGHDRAAGSAQ